MDGVVTAVSRSDGHTFSKPVCASIYLLAGLGVDGDAHCGTTVKHRSRVRVDPDQPNLRQVHLIHSELHDELRAAGFGRDRVRRQAQHEVAARVDREGEPTLRDRHADAAGAGL